MPQLIKLETQQDMVYTPKEGYVTKALSKDADGNIVQIIKNSDGDFVLIKGGSGSSSITSATHKDVSSLDLVNGYIVIDGDSLPVAVLLNDVIYSVSLCPIIRLLGSLKMLSSYFLTKAKLLEYTGVYKIWLATGLKGEKGEKGDKGEDGAVSFDELTATQILMLKGEKGDKGDKGDTGLTGPKGDTGEQGPKGDKGDTGEQGPKGDKGDTGEQGPKGDKGDSFNVDETGTLSLLATHKDKPKGFSFLDILNGNVYIKNSDALSDWSEPLPFKGPKGDTGDTGPKGDKGDKGDTGEQGPKGDKGDTGLTGPKGDTGEQGPKGDRGDSFNVDETGSLSLLATHKDKPKGFSFLDILNGDIYIKNSDALSDWSLPLPFKGPKGDTGEQGPKGDKGDAGEQGPKGDKGDTGEQGIQGPKGDTGEQGPKGDKGDTGEQGPKGDKGDTGEQGPKGDRGDSFNVDETGPLSLLVTHKDKPKGFSFLDILNGNIYIKNSDDLGDWSEPLPFKGPKGDTGEQGPKGDTGLKGLDGIIYNSKMVVNLTVIFLNKLYILVSVNLIPVAVLILDKLYYINDLIILKKNNKVLIPVLYLLTKASKAEFTAGWIVYFSGGVPGEKGLKGDPGKNGINYKVLICTVLPLNPDPATMYLIVLSE